MTSASAITAASFSELGLPVGHWTHPEQFTGCTVVLCPGGAVVSGEVRGAAPGTRETDLLRPGGLVGRVDAIALCGGSAPGLAAADGVLQHLRGEGIGYSIGDVVIPIVPAAVIFDTGAAMGLAPGAAEGAAAARAASRDETQVGRVGAGAGARVGKSAGPDGSSAAGLGHAALRVGDLVVGAMIVVNAFGEVRDPATGAIVAGARVAGQFVPSIELLAAAANSFSNTPNTVIGLVATNTPLDQAALSVVARMANAGLARTIVPAHTMFDGDTMFALSYSPEGAPSLQLPAPLLTTLVGSLAAEAVIMAVLNAVRAAEEP